MKVPSYSVSRWQELREMWLCPHSSCSPELPDTSCGEDYEKALAAYIASQEDVVQVVDMLHSRMFGNKTYIELELQVDGNLPLREAHAIAERIQNYWPDCKTACDAVLLMHRNISFYYLWRKLWL